MAAFLGRISEAGWDPTRTAAWTLALVPRSEVAEQLAAPHGHPGRPFLKYALRNGAIILIPSQGPARSGGLALYNPQMVAGLAAKGLMWSRLWAGQAVHLRAEPLEQLRESLAGCLGQSDIELAFQFGATGIYSKTTILVMNSAGWPLAYARLAATTLAQEALLCEAATIERLSRDAGLNGRVPDFLGRFEWKGFPVIVISAGPTRRAPSVFGAAHADFLRRLKEATPAPIALAASGAWRTMTERRKAWDSRLSPEWRDRYDWTLGEMEAKLGSASLDLAMGHRDFVPWNTRLNSDGTLFVFDWEFSTPESTPGWDLFHFHVALWAARGRMLDAEGLSELLAAAQRGGIEPAEGCLLAYLTDMALFHHDAMLREGREHHRLLTSAARGIDTLRRQSGRQRHVR
jgi:hypothetical protein